MTELLTNSSHKLLLDGKWVPAVSNKTFNSENPSNGTRLGTLAFAAKEDVDRAVTAARVALAGPWGDLSPSQREAYLRRLGDLIAANAEELAQLESMENGKPIWHTRAIDAPVAAQLTYSFAGWPSKNRRLHAFRFCAQ